MSSLLRVELTRLTYVLDWKLTFQADMRDYATCFDQLLERFSSQGRHLQKWLENHQRKLSQAANRQMNNRSQQLHDHIVNAASHYDDVEAHIQQYQKDREILIRGVREQEQKRKEEMYTNVLTWISAPWHAQVQYHVRWLDLRSPFPGTGQWILKTDKLWEWMSPDTPPQSLLWMNGKMGAGEQSDILQVKPSTVQTSLTTEQGRRFSLRKSSNTARRWKAL